MDIIGNEMVYIQQFGRSYNMICEEILGLLYGNIVSEVISNSENLVQANDRLDKMYAFPNKSGVKIGTKIVDEFMQAPENQYQTCTKLKQLVDRFCTVGVKKFLNPQECKCEDYRQKDGGCEFKMRVTENPLLRYVELPTQMKNANLQYQSMMKGAMRKAFEILGLKAAITIIYESMKEKNETIFFIELTKFNEKNRNE